MKKQLFRILSGVIPAIAAISSAMAQVDNNAPGPDYIKDDMEHITSTGAATTTENRAPLANTRALNNFSRNFKNAGNAVWYSIKNGFLVKFEEDGVQAKAFYDTKGNLSATLRTYSAARLPREIHKQVTVAYYGYTIYLVNELTVGTKTAYLVSISNEEEVKTIRVTDDEMDVYEEFKKI